MMKLIALIGEYNPTFKPLVATNAAIEHSVIGSAIDVDADWVPTRSTIPCFERYPGLWVTSGSPAVLNVQQTLVTNPF